MIVVFGSINVDLTARVERFPQPGETIAGSSFATVPGGKGANQALAARRAGPSWQWSGPSAPTRWREGAFGADQCRRRYRQACGASRRRPGLR
jgi:ribokinase